MFSLHQYLIVNLGFPLGLLGTLVLIAPGPEVINFFHAQLK